MRGYFYVNKIMEIVIFCNLCDKGGEIDWRIQKTQLIALNVKLSAV